MPDIAALLTSGAAREAIVHDGRADAGVELLNKRRDGLARMARRRQRWCARQGMPGGTSLNLSNKLPAAPDGAAPAPLNILVVEDNLDAQQMVCKLVGMLGHTVSGVADAERAWELLREQDFDILFSDVSLPGMSGIELARRVLREKPATRIIFSTGYGRETLDELGFPARILHKPYDLMALKAALE